MSAEHRTAEWAAVRRRARPIIEASLPAPCVDCGGPVLRSQRWQVGHRVSVAVAKQQGWPLSRIHALTNLGPSHAKARGQRACNQIEGGKLGAQIRNDRRRAQRAARTGLPGW